jgi:ABC-type uncharacterized transport system fused permease/ATPase subunit
MDNVEALVETQLSLLLPKLVGFASTLRARPKTCVFGAVTLWAGFFFATRKTKKHGSGPPKKTKRSLKENLEFGRQLLALLKIVIPGVFCREFAIFSAHTVFLVMRTFLSIYVASLEGAIVKGLVDRKPVKFSLQILKWLLVAIPATFVNSMIRYLESMLSLSFRSRLATHAYQRYMQSETYYRVGNLDDRLTNPDQSLTEDVSKFCTNLAHLHSQLSKPILDVALMSYQLVRLRRNAERREGTSGQVGPVPGILAGLVIFFTAQILKFAQPSFGKMVSHQAKLEGHLRHVNARLIANSEEIAFYRGHDIEHGVLLGAYQSLRDHMSGLYQARIFYTMLEGFFMKYVWSATGLTMIAIPSFYLASTHQATAEDVLTRTQNFVTAKSLLISAADAVERIMLAYKDVAELAGYTERVHEMLTVFDEVAVNKYSKHMLGSFDIGKARGVVEVGDFVVFEKVPIVAPNGDILVQDVTFTIRRGQHLLISGPNGCGKSSLFRILGGLWPVFGGRVVRPQSSQLCYIPQRPYLPIGNLRCQVIYPDTEEEMRRKGKTDADLSGLLEWVKLGPVLQREGGWNSVKEWKDVLSGGEKQRIGFCRVFYHMPHFAILDECTSAVSMDVEAQMYQHCIDLGISLLTVSHRPSLWKFHSHLLQFSDRSVAFGELNAEARLSLKDEKSMIEHKLNGVPEMQRRLALLCELLGEESVCCVDQPVDADAILLGGAGEV